jgi:hypothetical protein
MPKSSRPSLLVDARIPKAYYGFGSSAVFVFVLHSAIRIIRTVAEHIRKSCIFPKMCKYVAAFQNIIALDSGGFVVPLILVALFI